MKSLSCDQARRLLSDLLTGEIEPQDAETVEAHLAWCGPCRAAAEAFTLQDRRLAELAGHACLNDLAALIRAALAEAVQPPALNSVTAGSEADRGRLPAAGEPDDGDQRAADAEPAGIPFSANGQRVAGDRKGARRFGSASGRWWVAGVAASVLVALGLSYWAFRRGPAADPAIARLEQVQGEVYVVSQGAQTVARPGQPLLSGQGLQIVGEDSSTVVVYPDATRLEFRADTTVARLSGGTETGKQVVLAEGFLAAEVAEQPLDQPMVVATPHAEVLVRATKFNLSNEAEATHIEIEQGAVQLTRKSDGTSIQVGAGFDALATSGVGPMAPQPLPHRLETARMTLPGYRGAALSRDGQTLATWRPNLTRAALWELATGRQRATLEGHVRGVIAAAFSPDGATLATGSADRTVKLWDVATGRLKTTLGEHEGVIWVVAFSFDGKALAAMAGPDRTVTLWDLATEQSRTALAGYPAPIKISALSPDGRTLAAAGEDGTAVTLWDLATGQPRATCRLGKVHRILSALAFSPDGAVLAAGSSGVVTLCDPRSGQVRGAVAASTSRTFCMAFSPDGTLLAMGHNTAVTLVDLATGKRVAAFHGHPKPVISIAFTPDGRTLIAGSGVGEDSAVRVWDVPATNPAGP